MLGSFLGQERDLNSADGPYADCYIPQSGRECEAIQALTGKLSISYSLISRFLSNLLDQRLPPF